jgi:puromycin-sensitive aminopeptidase
VDYEAIDLMNFRFEGSERVRLRVAEPTRTITCHAVELYVFDVSVELEGEEGDTRTLECQQIQYFVKDESVTFHFAETLPAGVLATLKLRFHGFLNDQLRGFYRSEYDLHGEKHVLAVTQFEACDARRAFVCWDEPAIKATFEISMVTDVDLVALSNMHVVQTLVRPKKNAHLRKLTRSDRDASEKLWKFAETPVMSTYLVAMVVGKFDVASDVSKEGVIVNVYTAPGQSTRGHFALSVATKALSFFTETFGIPYPLKKLDMVAIPNFLGAMENWGLVTYSENYLLVDEKLSSRRTMIETCFTVCHELSHQWFGNLVTMEWWTGLWLNEGFAQYMQFDATDKLFPEWRVWDTFVKDIMLGSAFVKDSMLSSHPIEVVVNHPHEADEIFDAISYHKGSSIVRMLSEFLGRDVFYRGVHNYLAKFSYKNTTSEDLWDALEQASGQKITQMADSWTKQMGFPLITVDQDKDGKYMVLQERFLADKSQKPVGEGTLWDVPLAFVSSEDPTKTKRAGIWSAKTTHASSGKQPPSTSLIASDEINAQIQVPAGSGGWIKLNPSQSSFYLVNYTPELWQRLQVPVKERLLGVADRVSLVNSVFTFARCGVVPLSLALDFTQAYADETEVECWKDISESLNYYSTLYREEPFYPGLQAYIRKLFANVMTHLTWDSSSATMPSSDDGHFRSLVIAQLGRAGDESVIAEAQRRFSAYFKGDKSVLSADLRETVFSIQLAHGDASHVKILQDLYDTSDHAEERSDCLRAMGRVPDEGLKRQVLDWALEHVRSQDIRQPFASVATNAAGVRIAWQFCQDKWDVVIKKVAPIMLGSLIGVVVGRFHHANDAAAVASWLASKDTASFKRTLDVALEGVRLKSTAFERDRDTLAKWLQSSST